MLAIVVHCPSRCSTLPVNRGPSRTISLLSGSPDDVRNGTNSVQWGFASYLFAVQCCAIFTAVCTVHSPHFFHRQLLDRVLLNVHTGRPSIVCLNVSENFGEDLLPPKVPKREPARQRSEGARERRERRGVWEGEGEGEGCMPCARRAVACVCRGFNVACSCGTERAQSSDASINPYV